MSFDLAQAMVDVVWSPFNAGVFIALSLNKAYAYNLEKNRHTRFAEIKPTNKALTNLAFNPFHPIFLVGDNYGSTVVFKMDKVLCERILYLNFLAPTTPIDDQFIQAEKEKMDKLLLLGNFEMDDEDEENNIY